MADLTMCKDVRCPLRQTCKRYIGRPSVNQSYQVWARVGMACNGYIPETATEAPTAPQTPGAITEDSL